MLVAVTGQNYTQYCPNTKQNVSYVLGGVIIFFGELHGISSNLTTLYILYSQVPPQLAEHHTRVSPERTCSRSFQGTIFYNMIMILIEKFTTRVF